MKLKTERLNQKQSPKPTNTHTIGKFTKTRWYAEWCVAWYVINSTHTYKHTKTIFFCSFGKKKRGGGGVQHEQKNKSFCNYL